MILQGAPFHKSPLLLHRIGFIPEDLGSCILYEIYQSHNCSPFMFAFPDRTSRPYFLNNFDAMPRTSSSTDPSLFPSRNWPSNPGSPS
ncbi:MAG: hypothetical protein JW793_06910 [Acidobacteria bacterium]|nr:hypothetical protein [Acidobacteriota bacterium]